MTTPGIRREILVTSREFKQFWKENGPFAYALTSNEFPPVLLAPDEWIFSNTRVAVLKELIRFDQRKMRAVRAPFNPENRSILRPDRLSSWKILHFPEEWAGFDCDLFVPQGHLTLDVFDGHGEDEAHMDAAAVENAFFNCLANRMDQLGYLLLAPAGQSKYASIQSYLSEWEADDREAGL
ncbi:MAG: hypothetical protein MI862_17875 [Desulfobacterales bacterium]|nr:hypothetical protein [Desulfobacterales bacterium]